jgi:hypothetical protein
MYKFYLKDPKSTSPEWIEVEEPNGWDSVEFTLQRSDLFIGLENDFSDNLTFEILGAQLLKNAFDKYCFDGDIDIKIESYCGDQNSGYTILSDETITGVINLITYREEQGAITVKMEDSGFSRKFKNRLDTVVNFDDQLSIEGESLSNLPAVNVLLHSKKIRYQNKFKINPSLNNFSYSASNAHTPPFISEVNEIPGANEPVSYDAPFQLIYSGNSGSRTFKVEGRIVVSTQFSLTYNDGSVIVTEYFAGGFVFIANLYDSSMNYVSTMNLHTEPVYNTTTAIQSDFSFDVEIDIPQNHYLSLIFINAHEIDLTSSAISRTQNLIYDVDNSYLNITEDSVVNASRCKSYFVYEALNRVLESITDTKDVLRSDFFGGLTSFPKPYLENGCARYLALTNGLNLRKMLDKEGNSFPFTASFMQLFDGLNSIFNIGLRIEKDGDKFYIRIEPKQYFFNSDEIIFTATNVSDIERTVATDLIYNEFECGYEKWEVENISGIDEFNSKRFYSLPVKNAKKKLVANSKFITGSYAIEKTRRMQYSENPSTDSKYDNDLFLICTNTSELTFTSEADNPFHTETESYPRNYNPGEVAERNENYASVTNFFSPETAYNLRISPANIAINWYPVLASSLIQDPNKKVQFRSGTGNYQMKSESLSSCSSSNGELSENQNFGQSEIIGGSDQPYYRPIYANFSYPLTRSQYYQIKQFSTYGIAFGCGETNLTVGLLKEIKFNPNIDGGIARFKVLESYCKQGAYDESFDESFDIGTC